MTKEELIALSDLNREDNIKYISSEAQGIAITLDSDRYAPTFCKLERAYICGRRKSEEQIEELEKENAELKEALEGYKKIAKWCDKCDKIAELEKENAEAKERIKTLEYRCENIKDTDTMELVALQRENAELKAFKEKCKFNVSDICKDIETENNLTKAKEILKQWLQTSKASGCDNINIVTDTEQFLNEVEK